MGDPVNHPKHYCSHPSGVECVQVAEHFNFALGNAIKYIWRADEKGNAIEDLEKASWYISREIERRRSLEDEVPMIDATEAGTEGPRMCPPIDDPEHGNVPCPWCKNPVPVHARHPDYASVCMDFRRSVIDRSKLEAERDTLAGKLAHARDEIARLRLVERPKDKCKTCMGFGYVADSSTNCFAAVPCPACNSVVITNHDPGDC